MSLSQLIWVTLLVIIVTFDIHCNSSSTRRLQSNNQQPHGRVINVLYVRHTESMSNAAKEAKKARNEGRTPEEEGSKSKHDSPLSKLGINQLHKLFRKGGDVILQNDKLKSLLTTDGKKIVFAVSTLRRTQIEGIFLRRSLEKAAKAQELESLASNVTNATFSILEALREVSCSASSTTKFKKTYVKKEKYPNCGEMHNDGTNPSKGWWRYLQKAYQNKCTMINNANKFKCITPEFSDVFNKTTDFMSNLCKKANLVGNVHGALNPCNLGDPYKEFAKWLTHEDRDDAGLIIVAGHGMWFRKFVDKYGDECMKQYFGGGNENNLGNGEMVHVQLRRKPKYANNNKKRHHIEIFKIDHVWQEDQGDS